MHLKIPRLYDSHTHFLATGEFASALRLDSLTDPRDLLGLEVKSQHLRGNWLMGFGWSDSLWPPERKAHKKFLDEIYPDKPVFFSRADGHGSWLNSAALKELNIESDSGVLLETDHLNAWEKLPKFTPSQTRSHILAACKQFNEAGFTHIRDMNGTESLWSLLAQMEESLDLTLAVESNFTFYDLNQLEKAQQESLRTKSHETKLLRSKGVKFFFDGTLGSETAYLSQPYRGIAGGNQGRALWSERDVEEILKSTWSKKLEVAVHVIGDEAAHQIVKTARKVSAEGHVGRLNLEHVQVLRPETIQMMKPLHVRCHMQPCHWLSDKAWLKEKLGDLYKYAFPWESLRAAQIPLSFGCDSPIEPPSFFANQRALAESAKGRIRKFTGDIIEFHSHPDTNYADSYTVVSDGVVKELSFCGRLLKS